MGRQMKLAIMQPYFLPYIGYFQLIAAVDLFIVYDNIKYTKKGWINRNRMLKDGKDSTFSLPIKNDSDYLNVCQRELSVEFKRNKLLNQFKSAYLHAPYFSQTFALMEEIVQHENQNLFEFLHHAIIKVCAHLGITTAVMRSSDISIDHTLKNQEKVLALCEAVGAETYVNAIGGMALYSRDMFQQRGIDLKFIQSKPFEYQQFATTFTPGLTIMDVLMFNSISTTRSIIFEQMNLI